MKGKILDFSVQSASGIISGEDGNRYSFASSEWKQQSPPSKGQNVDFEFDGKEAKGIYLASESSPLDVLSGGGGAASKSKVAAGLLAILFGGMGIHKIYLGYYGVGFLTLGVFLLSLLLCIVVIGFIMLPILGTIGLIEGILYLTKSDEEFQRLYVENKRLFF